MTSSPDALVLGGGIAGSAVATLLARAGRRVTLLEQHAMPQHKVCGEFLSAEAIHYLRSLGVDPVDLGAVPVGRLRSSYGKAIVEAPLPFPALSLSRRVLDEALLQLASEAGVHILRGSPVEFLGRQYDNPNTISGGLWRADLRSGQTVEAPHAFLSTGKHDLRGHPRPPGRQNSLIALKQYLRLSPEQAAELSGYVELILFPGGYAGLQPVETDEAGYSRANLCVLIERSRYAAIGGTWPDLLLHMSRATPHLGRRLEDSTALLPRPLALSSIPYGYLSRKAAPGEHNLWRLGDQTAVIPSFSGDGMSIALHTAYCAARLYLEGRTAGDLATLLDAQLRRQVRLATGISQIMVRPSAQPLLAIAARLVPSALSLFARATRISSEALAPIGETSPVQRRILRKRE